MKLRVNLTGILFILSEFQEKGFWAENLKWNNEKYFFIVFKNISFLNFDLRKRYVCLFVCFLSLQMHADMTKLS